MKYISFKYCVFLIIMLGILSCRDKKLHPDLSDVHIDLNVVPFYKELIKIDTLKIEEEAPKLVNRYPEFMKAYSHRILKLGDPEHKIFPSKLHGFVTYQANKDIFEKSKEVFPSFKIFKEDLESGFKHYKYYFPDFKEPDIYLMISGFSQSIAVDSKWIGVSIEKYLGEECEFYSWLGIPKYLRKGMTKEKMAPDVLRAIALTNFANNNKVDDLINTMVYKGKIRYFVHRMFPNLADTLLFDYSADQMKWCKKNEENMWASLVEWKHLFQEDRMLIQKYTGDAPFTSNFGNNSAPRAGEFIGYKIIESYMRKNKSITLKKLMEETDGRKILAASNYRP